MLTIALLAVITPEARQAAGIAYPWVQMTLAAHPHREFELNGYVHTPTPSLRPAARRPAARPAFVDSFIWFLSNRLLSRHQHSFPKSLLEGDLLEGDWFKSLHALVFSAHPELARCYIEAAESDASHIPPASVEECLVEPSAASPGIYAYNTHVESAAQKFYIGRSQNIEKRLAAHRNPAVIGVNSIVRAAKATTDPTEWTSGALVTFNGDTFNGDFSHVPIGVWSAVETSLIACHGSTMSPGKAQINIVDKCTLPRPRVSEEVLKTLYEEFTR